MNEKQTAGEAGHSEAASSPEDLALEREKIQIERERLALERERLQAERDTWRGEMALKQRAAGRVALSPTTLVLALLLTTLAGVLLGVWVQSARRTSASNRMAENLLGAISGGTNNVGQAGPGQLLRAFGQPGQGGYLLILD